MLLRHVSRALPVKCRHTHHHIGTKGVEERTKECELTLQQGKVSQTKQARKRTVKQRPNTEVTALVSSIKREKRTKPDDAGDRDVNQEYLQSDERKTARKEGR